MAGRANVENGDMLRFLSKCEFKSSMAENGNFVLDVWRSGYTDMQVGGYVDPVPNYLPPHEVVDSASTEPARFPLNLLSPKPHAFLNTQYGNEIPQMKRQGEQRIMINPSDAASRSIANGSYVRVYNDRGTFEAKA